MPSGCHLFKGGKEDWGAGRSQRGKAPSYLWRSHAPPGEGASSFRRNGITGYTIYEMGFLCYAEKEEERGFWQWLM